MADVGSFGVNIPASPTEIALATVTGAVVGDVVSDFANNVSKALDNIYNATDNGKNEKHGDGGRAVNASQNPQKAAGVK